MTIESIVRLIGKPNIADMLSDEELQEVADGVIERADQDWNSMKSWRESVEKGIELCQPEFKSKDYPFPNAANYKTTILTEAANNFGNRATIELLRDPNLVKADIIGLRTIQNVIDKKHSEVSRLKEQLERHTMAMQQLMQQGGEQAANDPDVQQMQQVMDQIKAKINQNEQVIQAKKRDIRAKNERADRVTELMNWQINTKMCEWRKDHKRLMYTLPNAGTAFKKTYHDSTLGRSVSEVVTYPDFIVNQKTKSMNTCRSWTHQLAFSKTEAEVRMRSGLWRKVDLYDEEADLDEGSDEKSEAEETLDNDDKFYEQYCWLDMDNDGREEPYIVTVHVASTTVVRIVARFDEDSIIVKGQEDKPLTIGIGTLPLTDAQAKLARLIEEENERFNTDTPIPEPTDLSHFEVVRVEAAKMITKYSMIPSPDGDFLDVGFYHIIGSMALGVNKTTNDLLNAGTLSNLQAGVVAKDFRKKPGTFSLRPGEFTQTEVSSRELKNSILPLPYKEPSQTLFALNEKMENIARSFSANVDAAGQVQSNTAPTTALAMIQESLIPHTAHMSMIVDSMSEEFQILFELNRAFFSADDYKEIVGDEEAAFSEDFNTDGLSVICSANPEMSSRMQRMMLAQAEMEQVPMVIQAGGNPVPIVKNYYHRLGSENLDDIFPNEAEMSPDEKQQMQAMRQAQEYENQLAEQQVRMTQLQTELLGREQDRKDKEAAAGIQKTLAEVSKLLEEVREVKSDIILNLEKAESEQTKNQISVYTERGKQLDKAEQALVPPESPK